MVQLTADQVIAGLVRRGVPAHVAQGVAMNFRDESGFETGIQERNPLAGRGGYGLAQWTGRRRNALEDYASSRGMPVSDPDVQLDYFMRENAGPERAAWAKVNQAATPQAAAASFVKHWERPAPQYQARRINDYMGTPGGAGPFTMASNEPMPMPAPANSFADIYGRAIFGGGDEDWMQNKSYSFDALASDFLAGRNPMRRFIYQKLFG
jgi:Phage tail lysozyme